nr:MATE family efflux transporter [uncultured Methanosphaera sp.]
MHQNENDDTTKVDVIRGDPKVALKTIAWPMIFTLVLNMIYNMVDRVWVAGLGADPLAAIGFVAPIFIIIGGIGNGFGAGANSLISRYIGAKDKQNASNSAIHSILIALALSIIIPIILMPLLKQLLLLMGAESVLKLATDYATIIIIGGFTLIFNGVLSSQLRAEGDVSCNKSTCNNRYIKHNNRSNIHICTKSRSSRSSNSNSIISTCCNSPNALLDFS